MDLQTIETYNKLVKEYDEETADFWERFPKAFLDKFAELAKGKILNIGSGPGRDALLLKERALDVTCLDASEEMVRMTKEKGFDSVLGDFNNLPFKNGTFDGIWAYTSLLHVPKAEIGKPLAEISRILKPGGIFTLGLIEGEAEGYKESTGMTQPRWFSFFTKLEVEKLLIENGFKTIHFESFKPRSKTYINFISKKL